MLRGRTKEGKRVRDNQTEMRTSCLEKNKYLESNCGALITLVQSAVNSMSILTKRKGSHSVGCESISSQLTLSMRGSNTRKIQSRFRVDSCKYQ